MEDIQFIEKPYKVIEKSKKGSVYDKLLCVKCCSTIMRGNYSNHKNSTKHRELHYKIESLFDTLQTKQQKKILYLYNLIKNNIENIGPNNDNINHTLKLIKMLINGKIKINSPEQQDIFNMIKL